MQFSDHNKALDPKKKDISILFIVVMVIGVLAIALTVMFARNIWFPRGEFNMTVDPDTSPNHWIEIADSMNFDATTSYLSADLMVDDVGLTYASIKLDEILQSEGQYIDSDHRYLAYSFYIKNTGMETVTIDYQMTFTKVLYLMDTYVRILVIEDETLYRMYQKADQPGADNLMPPYNELPLGIDFESEAVIFRDTFYTFKPSDIKSFRVIIWLEEQDPDMNDTHPQGRMETQLVFSIREAHQANHNQSLLLLSDNKELWYTVSNACTVELSIYYEVD